MSMNLVIVESPAKAKTIKKYLGKDFEVLASYGHVRDLIPKEGAVAVDADFEMKYQLIEKNEKHVDSIKKALKKADTLYLATDLDREGEAISWHLREILKENNGLKNKQVYRVAFNEITKRAIQDAIANPRDLSIDLINAQQARRALDYLVGFNLSPLLWKKVQRGLSAGRVQSPALRLIVEREQEIEKFEAREYWTVEADCDKSSKAFVAKLRLYKNNKVEQFSFTDADGAHGAQNNLIKAANGKLKVTEVETKQRKRNPAPPFTTSTLQQEAARKLRFSAQRTMRTAQQLYEGIDIGGETVGLISYMRTDSLTLAQDALVEIRELIKERYGADNVPDEVRVYKNKSKNAQEAHEAIRPTSVKHLPDTIKNHLTPDQHKLYELIWKRTVACQMIHATLDTVSVDLACGTGNVFRATGTTIRHAGFIAVYMEDKDEGDTGDDDKESILPPMSQGDVINVQEIRADQHFTAPPPRYTEASLVKTLEEYGIGRPSTYASIISTLQNRQYVELENRQFTPTDIARIVITFLTQHFTQYVDYDFTARLEDRLDSISRGEDEWVPVMRDFWQPFKKLVDEKETGVSRADVAQSRLIGTDPESGKPVTVRMGPYGPFVQIGDKDDEEKPRFASLRPGQKMADIDLEKAFDLFQLPRKLGVTEDGEEIIANVGRFGPYVKYGSTFVSIRKELQTQGIDAYNIDLPAALTLIAEKKAFEANKYIKTFADSDVQVLNGRFGPYITDGQKNAKIPKDREPASLTLEECTAFLAAAPASRFKKKSAAKKAAPKKKAEAVKKEAAPKKKVAVKKTAVRKPSVKKTSVKTAADKKKTATKKTP